MMHYFTPHKLIFGLAGALACCAAACGNPAFQSEETQFENFESAVRRNDYDAAMRVLDDAQPHAKTEDDVQIIEYNKAVTEIFAGKCGDAVKRMKAMLEDEKSRHVTEYSQTPLLYDKMPHDIHMGAHHIIAVGLLCPMRPFPAPSQADFEEAVYHLTHIVQNGGDMRNLLSLAYMKRFEPCKSFVSPNEPKNYSYETAFSIIGLHGVTGEFTLCPGSGRWFRFYVRQHEIISLFLKLRALSRTFWIDDSSRLPYARIHVDVYKVPDAGAPLGKPIDSYAAPIPDELPSPNDFIFLRQQLDTPSMEVPETGEYLVHFYTEDNGEARITPVFNHWFNCEYIDDLKSYTKDFVQIPMTLTPDQTLFEQHLCPTRPDLYKVELEPKQTAIVSLRSTDPTLLDDPLSIRITDSRGRAFKAISAENGSSLPDDAHHSPHFEIFKGKFQKSRIFDEYYYTVHLLVENDLAVDDTLSVSIESKGNSRGLKHDIAMRKSVVCDKGHKPQTIELPMPLDTLNHDDMLFLTPQWLCPGDVARYKPTLPADESSYKATVYANVISENPTGDGDFEFSAHVILPPDSQAFISETSVQTPSAYWQAPHDMLDFNLLKPLLPNTRISLQMRGQNQGFVLTAVAPQTPKNKQDDQENSQENQEDRQQDPNKRDKNPSKDENTPTPDPEKPSDTPATPQGQGTETEGNESTPKPEDYSEGNAHRFDPNQVERDYVDALLDAIEQGQLEMPIQGQTHEKLPQKDW